MKTRAFVAIVPAALLVASLTGCSSAKSTTCEEFAKQSSTDQSSTIMDLIKANDLDPTSNMMGLVGVEQDVIQYCGAYGGTATKNSSSSINSAVNWSEYRK